MHHKIVIKLSIWNLHFIPSLYVLYYMKSNKCNLLFTDNLLLQWAVKHCDWIIESVNDCFGESNK